MGSYTLVSKIGEGTFGKVFKYSVENSDKFVAIKKIAIDAQQGIPPTTIREIKILKKLRSKSIVELKDVFSDGDNLSLVLEYLPYDLAGLIAAKYDFSDNLIYSLIYQIASALDFIHSNGMIHRDVKPGNILLSYDGRVKMADFGLAREKSKCMTNRVCTLWYRAPELLLGDMEYDSKIDSWSVGCIILELKHGKPFFKGKDEISQIKEILSMLGKPNTKYPWDDLFEMEIYTKNESFDELGNINFGSLYQGELLVIVKELMTLDKSCRLSMHNLARIPIIKERGKYLHNIEIKEVHEIDLKQK